MKKNYDFEKAQKVIGTKIKLGEHWFIEECPLDLIELPEYQRGLTKNAKAIAEKFNAKKVEEILISYRDGVIYCIDGQHRLSALKNLGKESWACRLFIGLTFEEEAKIFATQLDNVKAITPVERFKADVLAGDPMMNAINKMLKDLGIEIVKSNSHNQKATSITAVGTVIYIYKKSGEMRFRNIIQFYKDVEWWPDYPLIIKSSFLKGLDYFFYNHENNPVFDYDRLVTKISQISPGKLQQLAFQEIAYSEPHIRLASAMVTLYNKDKRINKLEPLIKL